MKKFIALSLCLVTLITLACCDAKQEDPIEDYTDVIELYQKVISVCAWYKDSEYNTYAKDLGITDPEQKVLFDKLLYAAYLNYPGRGREDHAALAHKLSCGYAIKDLNGDGVDELIFLQDDYTVVAVLSMSEGKPVLLGTYRPHRRCLFDGDGRLHHVGSNGADAGSHAVYKIADGGASLEMLVEFGLSGHEWVDGVAVQKYYKLENDLAMYITQEEYEQLATQWTYDDMSDSGLQFIPLFGELVTEDQAIEIAMAYWSHFDIEKNGYRVEHGYNEKAPDSVYVVLIRRLVMDSHYSTFDEIWVDKTTGDTMAPTWDPEPKG